MTVKRLLSAGFDSDPHPDSTIEIKKDPDPTVKNPHLRILLSRKTRSGSDSYRQENSDPALGKKTNK